MTGELTAMGLCDGCDTVTQVSASDDGRGQFCATCLPQANAVDEPIIDAEIVEPSCGACPCRDGECLNPPASPSEPVDRGACGECGRPAHIPPGDVDPEGWICTRCNTPAGSPRLAQRVEQAVHRSLERMGYFAAGPPLTRGVGPDDVRNAIVAGLQVLADELGGDKRDDRPRRLPAEPGAPILVTEVRGIELDEPQWAFLTADGPLQPWFTPDPIFTGADLDGYRWHQASDIRSWLPARLVRDDEHGPVAALEAIVRLLDGPQAEHAQEAQDVAKRALQRLGGGT